MSNKKRGELVVLLVVVAAILSSLVSAGMIDIDTISNTGKWFYCNATGVDMPGGDNGEAVGEYETFWMPPYTISPDVCDIDRDGVFDDECICPAYDPYYKLYKSPPKNKPCDSGGDDLTTPMEFDRCGCKEESCDSSKVNCLDEKGDGTCDDCENNGKAPSCSQLDEGPCEDATYCLWDDDLGCKPISKAGKTQLIPEEDCTNDNPCVSVKKEEWASIDKNCTLNGGDEICGPNQVCLGGIFITTGTNCGATGQNCRDTTNYCCKGGTCVDRDPTKKCEDPPNFGELCIADKEECYGEQWAGPEDQKSSSDEVPGELRCCLSSCYVVEDKIDMTDIFTAYEYKNESFICYSSPTNMNLFGECSYDSDYKNLELQDTYEKKDFNIFGTGSMLYAISTFDKVEGKLLRGKVQKTTGAKRKDCNNADRTDVARSLNLIDFGKSDWSDFEVLEFDVMFSKAIKEIRICGENGAEAGSFDFSQYTTSGDSLAKWHHVVIPLDTLDFKKQIKRVIVLPASESGTPEIVLDNMFLRDNEKIFKNYYCTGPFKRWTDAIEPEDEVSYDDTKSFDENLKNLPDAYHDDDETKGYLNNYLPYKFVCNDQLSFGWTGTKCCGDDQTKTKAYSAGTIEAYEDVSAGCWEGNIVDNNERVSDAFKIEGYHNNILFYEKKFHECTQQNSYFGNKITTQPSSRCDIKSTHYCAYNDVWETSILGVPDSEWQNKADDALEPKPGPGAAPTAYSGCCPDNRCWNGTACVNPGETTGDDKFLCKESSSAEWLECDFSATGAGGACDVIETTETQSFFCDSDNKWKTDSSGGASASERNTPKVKWDDSDNMSCCPLNFCWDGTNCQSSDLYEKDTQKEPVDQTNFVAGHRCIKNVTGYANWTWSVPKYDWDHHTQGYCAYQDQCFAVGGISDFSSYYASFTSSSICVNTTVYSEDHYCQIGNWSSRTKQIAVKLMSTIGLNTNYILYCDEKEKALNNPYYKMTPNVLTTEVNNFCVLKYSNNKTAFGTSLNNINIIDFMNKVLNRSAAWGTVYCDNVVGDWEACDAISPLTTANQLWFNNNTKSVIYTNTAEGISFTTSKGIPILSTIWNWIISAVGGGGVSAYDFVNYTIDFNRLYLAEKGGKAIQAITETKWSNVTGEVETYIAINYTNPGGNICNATDQLKQTAVPYALYFNCYERGSDYSVVSAQGMDENALPYWQDLTSKIRLK